MLLREKGTKRHECTGNCGIAKQRQELGGWLRYRETADRPQHARHRGYDQRVPGQRPQHLAHGIPNAALGLQADLDQHHRDREQHAHHDERRHQCRHQPLVAQHEHTQRNADIAGIRVGRAQAVDTRIDEWPRGTQAPYQNDQKYRDRRQRKGRHEAWMPDLGPARGRGGFEEKRRQTQPHHEPIQLRGRGGPESTATAAEIPRQDQPENRQQNVGDGRHADGRAAKSPRSVERANYTVEYLNKAYSILLKNH